MKKTILALLLAAFSLTASLQGADKVGSRTLVVDIGLAYSNYYRAQEALDKFQEQVNQADKEINDMIQAGIAVAESLQELQSKIDSPSTSADAKKKYTEEARKKSEDLRQREVEVNRFRQEKQNQLGERRQSILNLYLKEISEAAARIARERGADFVLNTGALVYADPEIDITEEVVQALNKNGTPPGGKKR